MGGLGRLLPRSHRQHLLRAFGVYVGYRELLVLWSKHLGCLILTSAGVSGLEDETHRSTRHSLRARAYTGCRCAWQRVTGMSRSRGSFASRVSLQNEPRVLAEESPFFSALIGLGRPGKNRQVRPTYPGLSPTRTAGPGLKAFPPQGCQKWFIPGHTRTQSARQSTGWPCCFER